MTSLAIRSLWGRKVRAATTTLAVVIGVAFVAGSYILTDTIFAAFNQIFSDSLKGTAVVITAKNPVEQEGGEVPTIPASLLGRVQRTAGVRLASGAIFTPGGFFNARHEAIGSKYSPKFISSSLPDGLESLNYVAGHRPRGPSEASIDKAAAENAGISIGDRFEIAGQTRVRSYRLVGLTRLGEASFGGTSIAQLTLPEAQRITDNRGRYDQISVAAARGVTPTVLKQRIRAIMPASVRVETGEENANRGSEQVRDKLGFFQTALLVFGGVALLVGAFLIFNTFSITVAQRVSEFGMLRTLGAARRQLLAAVIIEALVIGLLGAVLGLLGGFLIAKGLNALFVALGIDLPTTGLVLETRTVVVSLLIGIGVTLIASLVPALRATRVPPIAALRSLETPVSRRRQIAYAALAALLAALGVAVVLIGLFGSASGGTAAGLIGAGAVAVVLAVSLFSPRLVRPLAFLAGAPLQRLRRLTGRLARQNTQRNPSRTAVTAAALMIGVALVTFVTVFAAGIKGSVAAAVDESFQGQLVIRNGNGFSPIPAGAASLARRVPGIGLVSTLRSAQAKLIGGSSKPRVSALEPNAGEVLRLDWKRGGPATLRKLSDGEVILNHSFASSNGLGLGDRLSFLTQTGLRPSFRVVGEYIDKANLLGSAVITHRVMARDFNQRQDAIDFVKLAPGASPSAVQARLSRVIEAGFPTAEVSNQQELKEKQASQVDNLVHLIYALLGLAIVVSLFGIANTLALSIHERTRELGMLRAIGMSRRQVRTMIRYEAVITALIGAILGLILGVLFAALIAQPLKGEGFTLSYPVGTLVLLLVFSALAGVLAAIGPARRAARLDVLEALAYE